MNEWLLTLLDGVAQLGAWRYLIAFGGIFLETSLLVGLVVPGDTIVLITASGNRGWGEWALLVTAVVAGSLGGESVGFLIGRYFGPRLRMSRMGRRVGERQFLRAERWLDRRGGWAIFISRYLPVMHALMPVTVGAAGYPYGRFMRWTVPACVSWALIYGTVGTVAGASYRTLVEDLHWAGYLVIGGLVLFLIAVAVGKRLLHRVEQP